MVALSDYTVFTSAVMFNDSTSSSIAVEIATAMQNNSALLGWGTSEQGLVSWASEASVMVNAADWAADLSTLSNIACPSGFFPMMQQVLDPIEIDNCDVHTVCFVMSDGDNIQWILNSFATSTDWWASPDRGQIPITWTISPALVDLAPTILKYLYRTASNNSTTGGGSDYFIAAPSGTGYVYPDLYADISGFAQTTANYMAQSDLSILNVIADSNPAASDTTPFTSQSQIDAVFWYLYSNYAGLKGAISWSQGKPIIGAREMLWDGFNTPATLAAKLNASRKSCTSVDGYSLVVVHVWDQTVDTVIQTVNLLDERVVVVQADQFVQSIINNRVGQ